MYEFFVTVLLQVFIFCRLKINHESHEFILDSGTVTSTNITVVHLSAVRWVLISGLATFVTILIILLANPCAAAGGTEEPLQCFGLLRPEP